MSKYKSVDIESVRAYMFVCVFQTQFFPVTNEFVMVVLAMVVVCACTCVCAWVLE